MEDKWIVIVNVYAASKKAGALWRGIESQLKARGIDYRCHMTGADGNACELAHSAATEGYRRFVAVGGDGTVHDVLNGIMNYVDSPDAAGSGVAVCDFTLAVLPMGSGNDWIKSTGVPRDPVKALSMLASASFIRQDVVKVSLLDADGSVKTVSYMANIGGVGIDADVCRVVNVNKKLGYRGKILYVVALVRCLRKRVPVNVRIICDGKVLYHGSIFSIAFGVGKYSGGGMRQTSDAVLDDGLLDVTVIPDISLGVIARRAYRLFTSTFTQVKELTVGRGVSVEVVPEDVRPYAEVDGEVIGQAPVRFDVMPSHLNVLGVRR
jgi:YegS/Rv2252/BmrU family lipid kinase